MIQLEITESRAETHGQMCVSWRAQVFYSRRFVINKAFLQYASSMAACYSNGRALFNMLTLSSPEQKPNYQHKHTLTMCFNF